MPPSRLRQRLVSAFLDNVALLHDEDAVGLQNGREAVRDDDGRAAAHQFLQRLLHQLFAFGVECRGRFVEQQDRRVAQDRAGDGDALALAARQRQSALADLGVVAIGQGLDEDMRLGGFRGVDHRVAGRAGAGEGDVVGDGAGKDRHVLRHDGETRPGLGKRCLAQIDAVDQDAAVGGIVLAQQQREEGALAGAGRPGDGDGLAGLDRKVEILDGAVVRAGRIGKRDLLEGDRAFRRCGEGNRIFRRHDHRGFIQEFGQALGGAGGQLQLAPDLGQGGKRAGGKDGVKQELAEGAGRHGAGEHVLGADPQDRDDAGKHQEDRECRQAGAGARRYARGVEGRLDRAGKTRRCHRLVGEGLEAAHRGDRLAGIGGGVGKRVLRDAGAGAHAPAEGDERKNDDRDGGDDDARKRRTGYDHHAQRADAEDGVAQRDGCGCADNGLDLGGVGGQARDDLAGHGAVEEGGGKRHDMREDVAADVGDDALAERDDEIVARGAGAGEQRRDQHEHGKVVVDQLAVVVGETVIDHPPHRRRKRQRRSRSDDERNAGAGHEALVVFQIGPHPRKRPQRLAFAFSRGILRRVSHVFSIPSSVPVRIGPFCVLHRP